MNKNNFENVYTAVIQPSPFCNLACTYCYLPNRNNKAKMRMETLERVIQQLFTSKLVPEQININWHAGEPLALPIAYYQEAFELIKKLAKKYNKKYFYSMQTNGTIINTSWCDFIKSNEIVLGVSIDGPDFLHDKYRINRKGAATHALTMKGIKILQENNIPISVISVLTKESLDYADQIFDFFSTHKLYSLAFNPEESEGTNPQSSLTEEFYYKFKDFIIQFIRRIELSDSRFNIREIQQGFLSVLSKDRSYVLDYHNKTLVEKNLLPILTFDIDGNFYPLAPEFAGNKSKKYQDFIVGNIYENMIDDIYENKNMKNIILDVESGVVRCKNECAYFEFCGGDFPSNKFFEHGTLDVAETSHCRFRKKAVIDAIHQYLQDTLNKNI